MRKITIGFSTPKKFKFTSFLIRLFERSDYSHIYIKMGASKNSPLPFDKVFQASHGDVNAMTFLNFKDDNKIIHEYTIEVSEEQYFKCARYSWNQLGKPYGFMQLVGIAFNIDCFRNGQDKFICSEFAGILLKDHLGYDINIPMDNVGLNDIRAILEAGNDIS